MLSLEQLEAELSSIKSRNKKVEADKAWETSWTRKFFIILLTYVVVVSFFMVAGLPRPFINAIVPVVGFAVSTLTIGIIKSWWLKTFYKK